METARMFPAEELWLYLLRRKSAFANFFLATFTEIYIEGTFEGQDNIFYVTSCHGLCHCRLLAT